MDDVRLFIFITAERYERADRPLVASHFYNAIQSVAKDGLHDAERGREGGRGVDGEDVENKSG